MGAINLLFRPSGRARGRGHRHGRLVALLLAAWMLALALPGVAIAQTIPRLQDQVTDLTRSQVLAGGRARIEDALTDLRESRNIQLFVLFVETTGNRTVTQYADEVARQNSLGSNDALLVVALGDRSDALWRGSLLRERLTDRELEVILSERVEPLLARGDFAGAAVGGASGLSEAVVASGSRSGLPGTGGSGFSLWPIVLAVVLIVGGLWAWGAFSSRRRQRQAAEEAARQTERRAQEANTLLIQADEALRNAEEEIGYAEAQFGEAEVVPYREAVQQASTELKAAFALRQQLDDAEPETSEQRRQLVEQIVEHGTQAQAALDEQRQRIEQLRDVERRAPEILAALPGQMEALEARVPEARQTLGGLARYAERSWASVATNAEQAEKRLVEARSAVEEGQRALAANDRSAAGRSARTGQQAQAEAGQLLDAIDSLAQSLRQAEQSAGPQVAAAEADVRAARAAVNGHVGGDLLRRLAEAEAAVSGAERELTESRPDYLAAVRLAAQADTAADQILAEVRQEEERQEREQRVLEAQMQAAESAYAQAAHFIAARRRGMGWAPRTRLAEAGRHLEQARALAPTDSKEALVEARRAQQLAEEAYALAQQDFDDTGLYGGWGGVSRGGVFPVPFPIPTGGGWGGGGWSGGGGSWGGGIGSGSGGGGGGSVGGRW